MKKENLIMITGSAGFIGSQMAAFFNQKGQKKLILVDDFENQSKKTNWENIAYFRCISRDSLFEDNIENEEIFSQISMIIHLGARTDTTEQDYKILELKNVIFSQKIWTLALKFDIPLIYASSAATYGAGELGYSDINELSFKLNPLNPYGRSKNEFDKWALNQSKQPTNWSGLKFFNVYGPNEYHKKRMASVVYHSYLQIAKDKKVKLFKSEHSDFKDGHQKRDFIYVKDIVRIIYIMTERMLHKQWETSWNGLYNLGTGNAATFESLVTSVFKALNLPINIQYIDLPLDLKNIYQYFTQADMKKLQLVLGADCTFLNIEQGVEDYVKNYLSKIL